MAPMTAKHLGASVRAGLVCRSRGYHAPVVRTEVYRSFPGWEGYGDCPECGSTVLQSGAAGSPDASMFSIERKAG
jgi:hypothetical protein